jgi:hypothetical protein
MEICKLNLKKLKCIFWTILRHNFFGPSEAGIIVMTKWGLETRIQSLAKKVDCKVLI